MPQSATARTREEATRRSSFTGDPEEGQEPETARASASSAEPRPLRVEEQSTLHEAGLATDADDLGQQFLSEATQQDNFETTAGVTASETSPEEPLMTAEELERDLSSNEDLRNPRAETPQGSVEKLAHLTVSPQQIQDGQICACEACVRDGQHEPDCAVHDEPRGGCSCGVAEQREGAS